MITKEQLGYFSKMKKISEYVILREYIQLWFLSEFYKEKFSENVFFKGGTALHFIFGMDRFSEDLDFSVVDIDTNTLDERLERTFERLSKLENIRFKKRRSIAGKRFTLILNKKIFGNEVFIDLDFSFREKVIEGKASIIRTEYPVVFTSFVNHLSKEEILAEKIRALFTRKKGRDLYDIWFLLNQATAFNKELIKEKLRYYKLEDYKPEEMIKKIDSFNRKEFIIDLRPFVSIDRRDRLGEMFDYIINYLKLHISNIF